MTGLAQAVSVTEAGVGMEVICDPIVHYVAVAAIYFNSVPRFADVKYGTFLMDPESVRQNITERTKALIVTNLWGLCAELDELRAICDETPKRNSHKHAKQTQAPAFDLHRFRGRGRAFRRRLGHACAPQPLGRRRVVP